MALAKDRYGKVSNCRSYIDYCQYARAISYVDRYSSYGVTYESNIGTSSSTGDEMPWSYNPSLINNFVANDDSPFLRWNIQFNNHNDGNVPVKNRQFSRFLQTANYFGVLGHEFGYVNGLNNLSITLNKRWKENPNKHNKEINFEYPLPVNEGTTNFDFYV